MENCETHKHMALPVAIFDFFQSVRFEKVSLKGAQCTLEFVEGCIREFIFNSNVLGDDISFLWLRYSRGNYLRKPERVFAGLGNPWKLLEIPIYYWKSRFNNHQPLQQLKQVWSKYSNIVGLRQATVLRRRLSALDLLQKNVTLNVSLNTSNSYNLATCICLTAINYWYCSKTLFVVFLMSLLFVGLSSLLSLDG